MLRSLKIKDYIQENPNTVNKDANLFEAIAVITDNNLSGVCVVDDEGILVGMLSEMDCLEAIMGNVYNEDSNIDTVERYMTKEVQVAKPHYDTVSVAADMLASKHRRRPVVEDGKLVGLITCRRLLRVFKDFNYKK